MPLHFTREEFAQRIRAARAAMAAQNLEGLLLFAPESHYYLTGYDTFGFALFQCMVLPLEGAPQLLTRAPDLRQAQFTSTLADSQIHIWEDAADAKPHEQLAQLLGALALHGKRLGVELQSAGLTAYHGQKLYAALQGKAELIDASDLVCNLRMHKSAAEIAYIRRAAELSDAALDSALELTCAGADEGEILAAMHNTIFRGGGDYPGNEFIIGGGEGALLCRYYSGRGKLAARDQLTLEWAAAFRHYHAAMMRTVIIGRANARQKAMHAAAEEALLACESALRPGAAMAQVFAAHARVLDARGFGRARLNACGYSMGASYAPSWMDRPMFYRGNPTVMRAGNVFFLHMILMDSDAGLAMCLGHSLLLTKTGAQRLSRHGLQLLEC